MRSVKFLVAAGAAALLSTAAFAADMPQIMAPQPYYAPPQQDFGGWYLRGDIGMTNSKAKLHDNLYDTLPAGSTLTQLGAGVHRRHVLRRRRRLPVQQLVPR